MHHPWMTVAAGIAALLALAGCAAPYATNWNRVSAQDQHRYMPGMTPEVARPLVIVTTGSTGLVVGSGPALPAPAVQVVAQDGQLRLVSQETLARMNPGSPTSAMGAGGAAPADPVKRD